MRIPSSGTVRAAIIAQANNFDLWNASLDAGLAAISYNLSGTVGPVALSFSIGPQINEKNEVLSVINQAVRLYIYPEQSSLFGTYSNGTGVLRAIEYILGPQTTSSLYLPLR